MQQYLPAETVVFSARRDTGAEFDFIIPEYLPGIAKIITTHACVEKCMFITEGTHGFNEISVKFSVIYISDFGGKIRSAQFYETLKADMGDYTDDGTDGTATPSAYISSVSAKPSSPRKIHLVCSCHSSVIKSLQTKTELFDEEAHEGVCVLKKELDFCHRITLPEVLLEHEAEITLDSSDAGIGEIIYSYGEFCRSSCTPHDKSLDFEGEFLIHTLYETSSNDSQNSDDSTYAIVRTPVTVRASIDDDRIQEGQHAFIYLDLCSVSPSLSFDPYGENKALTCTLKYNACAFLYSKGSAEIVTDAFCERHDSRTEICDMSVESISGTVSDMVSISQSVRADIKDMTEISDCSVRILSVSTEQTEGKFFAATKCLLQIFGVNPEGVLCAATGTVTLRIPINTDALTDDDIIPDVLLSVKGCEVKIKEGGLFADFDVEVCGVIVKHSQVRLVSAMEISEKSKSGPAKGEITVYYPLSDDSLWSISKKYCINPKDIIASNSLEGDDISGKKIIIIP